MEEANMETLPVVIAILVSLLVLILGIAVAYFVRP